ncbi:mitochondrial aldehyde dehydrogenase [Neonectria magnoliae]|uniref:Mitochondrial aldehyde dehydrogenase n=1 Tax=Neonectria magnoliae TaxID=2732573 RepID=A0ABR1I507_9HYPO
MNKLADLVDRELETLAIIETLDNGKPLSISRGTDVPHFSEVLRYYAGYADKDFGKVIDVGLTRWPTPSSITLELARLVQEAGFPPGVINVLNGTGREVGAALAQHEGVDKIAFTGSTTTVKEIMKMAAGTMKTITLETGGKSPLIVFDDTNLDQTVKWAHEEGIYDTFVEKFKEYTDKASIHGDPFDEKTF